MRNDLFHFIQIFLRVGDHLSVLLIQDIIKTIHNTDKSLRRIGETIDLTRCSFFFLQRLF